MNMEEIAKNITINVSHAVEIISALLIGMALIRLIVQSVKNVQFSQNAGKPPRKGGLEGLRVQFGSSVAVALELLLGADVLATAVAPSWNDIGQLAAIATIRTVLNYFLERELNHVKSAA
jgi:uncharacterized membrane protein